LIAALEGLQGYARELANDRKTFFGNAASVMQGLHGLPITVQYNFHKLIARVMKYTLGGGNDWAKIDFGEATTMR
jgi:hypothetical protein